LKESPRWLVLKGRLDEAKDVILIGAKHNKSIFHIPFNLEEVLLDIHEVRKLDFELHVKNY